MHEHHNLLIAEEIEQAIACNHHKVVIFGYFMKVKRWLSGDVGRAPEVPDLEDAH